MNKYIFLFHVEQTINDPAFDEANMRWFKELGAKLLDGGNPFNPDAEASIKEGNVSHDVDSTAGYCAVSAANLEEAVELAKTCPMATMANCSVKIYETMAM